jgi:hypothetical protein
MSGEDKTVVRPVEIPGMQISFSSPIGPSGKGMNFVLSAGDDIEFADLNKKLDVIAAAARRQDAFEQLRLDQNALVGNRRLLPTVTAKRDKLRDERSDLLRKMEAKLTVVMPGQRRPQQREALPQDISMLATFERDIEKEENRIFEIEAQIVGCEERIPFWKRLLRGEEPLDLDDVEPSKMAAE